MPFIYLIATLVCCIFGEGLCESAVVLRAEQGDGQNGVRGIAPEAAAPSTMPVSLSLNGGYEIYATGSSFVYYSTNITEVLPRSGPNSGGTVVTLFGSGFDFDTIDPTLARCRFELIDGSSISVELLEHSSSSVVCAGTPKCEGCDTASGPGCSLGVSFARNGNTYEAVAMRFTCYPPLTNFVVSPSAGPVDGGTSVTLISSTLGETGFLSSADARCFFGTIAVAATATSLGILCSPTPPLRSVAHVAEMAQPVTITLNGREEAQAVGNAPLFSYYQSPYVQRIEPTSGPVIGGEEAASGPVIARVYAF